MIKNITAILLAFILAAGGWAYWLRSSMDFDISQLWKQKENIEKSLENTEQPPSETEVIEISALEGIDAQVQQELDKYSIKDMGNFSPNELEAAVMKKYRNAFVVMEKGYEAKINGMMLTAITEYKSLPEQEKKNAMLTLGLKYLGEGAVLEDASDKSFVRVLELMKHELEENNLSLDILTDVKNQYEQEKNGRREALMEKALGQMK